MGDHERTGLLLFLLDHFNGVTGRTRVQKMLYLTNLVGWNAFDYRFYKYGPYSEWVWRMLNLMVQRGLVNETEKETKQNKTIYRYDLTESGSNYLQSIRLDPKLIEKTKQLFAKFDSFGTDDLEIMTSLHYIKKTEADVDTDDKLVKCVGEYKPHFTIQQIKDNLRIFKLEEFEPKIIA